MHWTTWHSVGHAGHILHPHAASTYNVPRMPCSCVRRLAPYIAGGNEQLQRLCWVDPFYLSGVCGTVDDGLPSSFCMVLWAPYEPAMVCVCPVKHPLMDVSKRETV